MSSQILLVLASVLLICIGSFAMTTQMPSLFIALLYLLIGVILLASVLIKYVKERSQK
ncbi:hypothetical protein [Staphylococcus carnosus]|uniref:hypothetical protein n=1 Tax=Staphylococcus carnosus TaxID=1281 RepID=UPI000AC0E4EE|nr:hypothetical protein [Staphylococcus carnosus]QPT03510.1 hypothetical protein I6G40_10560 [Staphylococcus carnosus]QQS85899.1 hypothetical protein I6J04_03670 [Staphylococcus carnosus]QRQ05834.1 hypothetical protein I6J34_04005 [Staphylococcus carnosus]UQA66233.1 hypothetical protein Sta3580_06595 [Staphylococcus carnosus]SUL91251.1 Uncharacterised protein [Staphylococcus carnosus]